MDKGNGRKLTLNYIKVFLALVILMFNRRIIEGKNDFLQ